MISSPKNGPASGVDDTLPSIRQCLLRARAEGRCALVPYLTMGYPDLETSLALLDALEAMGVDAVEVGIPFSDPVADGPTIQRTTDVALAHGVTLRICLQRLADHSATQTSPGARILFSYLNPLLSYGLDALGPALRAAGIGAALVTDLICEEAAGWQERCRRDGVETCFLVTATSDRSRMRQAAAASTGFVYCVSTLGVTGARKRLDPQAEQTVRALREESDVPVAVGFGISRAEDVRKVATFADAVVVGSAMLNAMGEAATGEEAVRRATGFLYPLLEATRS